MNIGFHLNHFERILSELLNVIDKMMCINQQ